MRTHVRTCVLAIAIAIVVAFTIWWALPTQAKQQLGVDPIDPFAMTGTVTNLLPEVHYDHGFIFPEQQ
jgi:steroid 5-alpha reductase family enzyme